MREIVERLKENRQIELAKSILESNGYKVSKRLNESSELEVVFKDPRRTKDNFDEIAYNFDGDVVLDTPLNLGRVTYRSTDDMVDVIWEDASRIYSFKEIDDIKAAIERVLSGFTAEDVEDEDYEDYVRIFNSALSKIDYVLGTAFAHKYNLD